MASFWNFPDNRYTAIEEVRRLLGFTKPEWKVLLRILSKTDSGWLQYTFASVKVGLKKLVDLNEIHIVIEKQGKDKPTMSLKYVYDLNDFTKPKVKITF